MADILWSQLEESLRLEYIKKLKILGRLSRLFKDSDGKNGRKPYLHYRNHEISYITSFKVMGITRKDSAFDAIVELQKDNQLVEKYGVGLKTWIHLGDKTYQKVAEFNKKSKELRQLFHENKDKELAQRIAQLRNDRIDDDRRLYATNRDIYHFITRDDNCFYIIECSYDKINIDAIHIIDKNDSSIIFTDGIGTYSFLISKSTLCKYFDASENQRIQKINITIEDDPFCLLEEIFQNSGKQISPGNSANIEEDYIVLPLYSDQDYSVPERSIFNASLGSSKNKGSNIPRPAYEAYAPIPLYIHHLYPNFFGFNALDKDARKPFSLHLPDGNRITAIVTQDNGKALQTNPQSILGKWLLFSIFGLQEYEMLTREILDEKEIDSIRIRKIDNENFKVEVCDYLEYERWKLAHKERIQQLKDKGVISRVPVFREELVDEQP